MRNSVLGQRYRILDRLGEGGMANVYRALDEKLGRYVAVKILHDHLRRNPDIRSRFQQEAQAVSTLDHPNIMRIYDFSGPEHEQLWLVAELISGTTLANLQQSRHDRRLPEIVAACIVREITRALEHAHKSGIVHRDIKPENVMVTQDGRLKLMDFGIAKDTHNHRKTQTGMFMGSPSYMSPEQVKGKNIDARSDICSLGVVFYELLTGRLPYEGASSADVIDKITKGEFVYPRFRTHGLSMDIDRIVVRCMQRNPEQRFQSVVELGNAIDAWLATQTVYSSAMELESFVLRGTTRSPESIAAASGSGIDPSGNPPVTIPEVKDAPRQSRKTKVRTAQPRKLPPAGSQPNAAPASPPRHVAQGPRHRPASQRELRRHVIVARQAPSQLPAWLAIIVAIVMGILWGTDFRLFRQLQRPAPQVSETKPDPAVPAPEEKPVAPAAETQKPVAREEPRDVPQPAASPARPPRPAAPGQRAAEPARGGKKDTRKQPSVTAAPVVSGAPAASTPPVATTQPTTSTTTAAKGRISISSQPAAEIFVNNRRVGTTVDAGGGSGWIAVNTGPVTITLRRNGYRDHTRKVNVNRDDRITLGMVTLERATPASRPARSDTRSLTITTNRWPANVIVTSNGDTSLPPLQFRLEQSSRTVRIPAGRHTIRVESGGEVRERRIDTAVTTGGITYSVEFSKPSAAGGGNAP